MEPRLQYAKTSDGANIAYWTIGDGPPLVMTPGSPMSPTLRSWRSDEGRRFYARLAAHRQVIRYDNRGFGESRGGKAEASLDAWVADLAAVVDRLGLSHFPLLGYAFSAEIAMAYTARFPERVSKLVLWGGSGRGADHFNVARIRAAQQTAEEDPEFFMRVVALEAFGWSASQHAERYVALMMEEEDRTLAIDATLLMLEIDVTNLLPALDLPVLLFTRRHAARPPLEAVRSLAAGLSNARLVVLEGDTGAIYLGDTEPVFRAIDDFLEDGASATPRSESRSVHTILFTDLVSSTPLTQRLGDAKAQELVRAHNAIVREALGSTGGSEVKHTGDGIMASFPTASGALECAIAIQRGVALRQAQGDGMEDLGVHIGLNAGEPVAEERDLFGTSVQLARRICDHAQAGQILTSNVIRELAAGKGFLFSDIGEVVPKGFDEAVRLYEVRWREETQDDRA